MLWQKQYAIYTNGSGERQVVKCGWSWPGFLLTWLWALIQRMWVEAVLLFVAGVLISAVATPGLSVGLWYLSIEFWRPAVEDKGSLPGWAGILIGLIAGFGTNDWKQRRLKRDGFWHETTVPARTRRGALERRLELESTRHE